MAAKSFKDAFKAIPKSKLQTAAKKERTFGNCTAPDGTYRAKLTGVRRAANDNGEGYASFNFVITEPGKYKGQTPSEFMGLVAKGKRTLEQAIAGLHWYLQDLGFETDETWGYDEFESAFAELDKNQPNVTIKIKNNGDFQNVRIVSVDDETGESTEADDEVVSGDESGATEKDNSERPEVNKDELYAEMETAFNDGAYDALQVMAQNAGSQVDANDFSGPNEWDDYWMAVVEELFSN